MTSSAARSIPTITSLTNLTTLEELQPSSPSSPSVINPLLSSLLQRTIPPLTCQSHKGSSGRIAIIGGSAKYSGAPYYAAMASLRTGMDLVTVHCATEASGPIKSYSPELMVDPFYTLDELDELVGGVEKEERIEVLVQRLAPTITQGKIYALVIGPGLGRDPIIMEVVARVIQIALENQVNLVLDADALFLLTQEPYRELLSQTNDDGKDEKRLSRSEVVLTPNVVEYKRLVDSIGNGSEGILREKLKGVVLIIKGQVDIIEKCMGQSNDDDSIRMECRQLGGLKRSGGIGDILAGTVGSFLAWNRLLLNSTKEEHLVNVSTQLGTEQEGQGDKGMNLILACWFACALTKRATRAAFEKRRRSMTAPDILEEIGAVVDEYASSTIQEELM